MCQKTVRELKHENERISHLCIPAFFLIGTGTNHLH